MAGNPLSTGKVMNKLKEFWNYILSFFNFASAKSAVVTLAHNIEQLVYVVQPIVEEIDKHLKPAVKDSELTVREAIEVFLGRYDIDKALAAEQAAKLAYFPTADMLFNVAVLVAKQTTSVPSELSKLNLAIELAYNLYKLR